METTGLAQLTDAYVAPDNTFPVEPLYAPAVKEDAITIHPVIDAQVPEARPEPRPEPMGLLANFGMAGVADKSGKSESPLIKKLFGLGGEERHQSWPEKVVRDALERAGSLLPTMDDQNIGLQDIFKNALADQYPTYSIAGSVYPGLRREDFTDKPKPSMPTDDSTWLGKVLGVAPVAAQPNDYMIDAAQSIAALAGSGGFAGATDATLGAGPFLRPALKYDNKIYKAPLNGQHLDALPAHLQETFHKQAMSGEDISHFDFGFMNHKGQFLSREAALDYAIKEGLVDPHAGQYGALTSTLLADSSKPGTAIEAMAKSGKKIKLVKVEHDPFVPLSPEAIEHYAKRVAGPVWEKMTPEQRTEFMSKPIKGYSMNDYNAEMQGYMPDDWYHGSLRSDRLTENGKINPKRATSGPMPFFSNDPEMASSYAMGKKGDTSLMKHDPGDNVANYFTVSPKELGHTHGRTPYTVEQSWHHLKPEVKADILDKYHRIGYENRDTGEGPYTLHKEPYSGLSGKDHYEWVLKHEAKGNPLTALRNIWHDGGNLVGNETDLAEIYKLAGYPHKISEANAPWTEARGVMPAKLRIQTPLMTDNKEEILNKVIPHLEQVFKNDRSRVKEFGADMWDKETKWTPKEWVKQLKEDTLKGDNGYTWTSIPDKITNELKRLGYDGIIDTGGKGAGVDTHKVAIPFTADQVRSKYAKFDPVSVGKSGILLADSSKPGAAIQAIKQPFYSALEHNVNQITQSKMTGDQWLGTLANKPGVKPEELQWTGLQEFLSENKGKPVSKEQIQEHLATNKVELKEVNKADKVAIDPVVKFIHESMGPASKHITDAASIADARKFNAHFRETTKGMSDEEVLAAARASEKLEGLGDSKYHSYQLPGGENYREKLLTLPSKAANATELPKGARPIKLQNDRWWVSNEDGTDLSRGDFGSKEEAVKSALAHINEGRFRAYQNENNYKSSHWDELNILAHVRVNDRFTPVEYTAEEKAALAARQAGQTKMDAIRKEQYEVGQEINDAALDARETNDAKLRADFKAGKIDMREFRTRSEAYEPDNLKPLQDQLQELRSQEDAVRKSLPKEPEQKQLKSLHLEEMQSDWLQAGRDKGFKSGFHPDAFRIEELPDKKGFKLYYKGNPDEFGKKENFLIDTFKSKGEANAFIRKGEIPDRLGNVLSKSDIKPGEVPDAPFKKTWHELALKRMIREAAEKGYDRLSWTPGEAQAARYDLSKQVDKIAVPMVNENGIRSVRIDSKEGTPFKLMVDKDGKVESAGASSDQFGGKPLSDVVGKEMADKIMKLEKPDEFSGEGLKIGGEGMKGFYDKMIPTALEKIGKEHGVKVKQGVIRGHQYKGYDSYEAGQSQVGGNAVFGVKSNGEKVLINQSYSDMKSAVEAAKNLNLGGEASKIHYIDLPQSLKDQAMHKGFPLFSGGYQFIPVQGDPFNRDKK